MSFIQITRLLSLLVVFVCTSGAIACDRRETAHENTALGNTPCESGVRIDTLPPMLREASGVAASHAHAGVLWVHNDSNNPFVIVALDTLAHVIGTVRILSPLADMDWEDIAIARCNGRDCIYLADIGDNYTTRHTLRLLRFNEPVPGADSTATPDVFPFRFPDGRHDAEALFILPDERVFIITKGRNGPVALYSYPGTLRPDTVVLTHIRDLTPGIVQFPQMVTGASASADGRIVAVRSYSFLRLYQPQASGDIESVGDSIPLAPLHEFQGEGVTIGPRGRLFFVGEKGFDTIPPPMSGMVCRTGQ